jgi:hypothetical protein
VTTSSRKLSIYETEHWVHETAARLSVLQVRVAAETSRIFGPHNLSNESKPNAHATYHIPEIVAGRHGVGTVVIYDTSRNIESAQGELKAVFRHWSVVHTAEDALAGRMDDRAFSLSVLRPLFGAISATAASAMATAASASEFAADPEGADAGSDSGSDSEPPVAAAADVVAPYTRYPNAHPVSAHCTGALWPGARWVNDRGASRLSPRLLQAFAAAHVAAFGKAPDLTKC